MSDKGEDQMATKTVQRSNGAATMIDQPRATEQLPAKVVPARLPYPKVIGERFNVTDMEWKALVEAVFPLATTIDSVALALAYCQARKLDPFKKVIHIVPIWSKEKNCMVDTIWPGIGELRTTAFRTGCYAGRGETVFGPEVSIKVGRIDMRFPEWAQVTLKRLVKGVVVEFAGPRVYWLETYSTIKRDDKSPNSMWERRPRGQLEKCTEAAALRAAFPEEIGDEHSVDEIGVLSGPETRKIIDAPTPTQGSRSDQLAGLLESRKATPEPESEAAEDEKPEKPDTAETVAKYREFLSHAANEEEVSLTFEEIRRDAAEGLLTDADVKVLKEVAEMAAAKWQS